MTGARMKVRFSSRVSMANSRQNSTNLTHVKTQLALLLVQIFLVIKPTLFIGLYLAIWTGVGLPTDQNPPFWLFVLADVFNYACNLAAYLGLVIIFASRFSWTSPVASVAAAPTVNQQPADPLALDAQQHEATPTPGSGVLQTQERA